MFYIAGGHPEWTCGSTVGLFCPAGVAFTEHSYRQFLVTVLQHPRYHLHLLVLLLLASPPGLLGVNTSWGATRGKLFPGWPGFSDPVLSGILAGLLMEWPCVGKKAAHWGHTHTHSCLAHTPPHKTSRFSHLSQEKAQKCTQDRG